VSGDPVTYTNWRSGEPNDVAGEDCVSFNQTESNKWNNDGCNKSFYYMCEKE